jgi:hypothetical protein
VSPLSFLLYEYTREFPDGQPPSPLPSFGRFILSPGSRGSAP